MFSAGPFVWLATMSMRTTTEIIAEPLRPAEHLVHWEKFRMRLGSTPTIAIYFYEQR